MYVKHFQCESLLFIENGLASVREHRVRPLCLQILWLLRKCAKAIGMCFLNAKVVMTIQI